MVVEHENRGYCYGEMKELYCNLQCKNHFTYKLDNLNCLLYTY